MLPSHYGGGVRWKPGMWWQLILKLILTCSISLGTARDQDNEKSINRTVNLTIHHSLKSSLLKKRLVRSLAEKSAFIVKLQIELNFVLNQVFESVTSIFKSKVTVKNLFQVWFPNT